MNRTPVKQECRALEAKPLLCRLEPAREPQERGEGAENPSPIRGTILGDGTVWPQSLDFPKAPTPGSGSFCH